MIIELLNMLKQSTYICTRISMQSEYMPSGVIVSEELFRNVQTLIRRSRTFQTLPDVEEDRLT